MDGDARAVALEDAGAGFRTGRVVDADEAVEGEGCFILLARQQTVAGGGGGDFVLLGGGERGGGEG